MAKKKKKLIGFRLPRRLNWRQMVIGLGLLLTILLLPLPQVLTRESSSVKAKLHTQASLNQNLPPIAVNTLAIPTPETTAQSVYIIDPDSYHVLYEKNAHAQLPPASTTKLMTALIAIENYPLDQVITITQEDRSIGQTMKLVSGEQIKVEDLVAGILINSGNDAAAALALAYPQTGYSGFINQMNLKAKQLGMHNSQFRNVSGLGSQNHYSSARDLALLTIEAMKNPTVRRFVATQQTTVTSVDGQIVHPLYSTNQLLNQIEGVVGVKTGWTELAGECLITLVERETGSVIIVVLGSEDRFGETISLVDWVYQSHEWIAPEDIFKN